MHDNEGDDDDGYDDHNGDDDDDKARSGRGLRDPWIDRWIWETHETVVISELYIHCDAWSSNIVVRESRFLLIKQMWVSWRGFEVKPCKSET